MIQSIAVFCGSQAGKNPVYAQQARETGKQIAERKLHLVYGGGNRGLMGITANAVLEAGGTVTGVIPGLLNEREHQHDMLTQLYVVDDMHKRKKMMYELCDAAIILPGGYGTMDELFEMITWNQLSIHDKKIILLNSDGYYDSLLEHFEKMYSDGFLYDDWRSSITIAASVDALFEQLIG